MYTKWVMVAVLDGVGLWFASYILNTYFHKIQIVEQAYMTHNKKLN